MNVPLGRAVGNWPEVEESIECLRGEHADTSLMEVVIALAGEMLALGGAAETPDAGRIQAREAVADGRALDTFRRLVERQGGDVGVVDDPSSRPESRVRAVVDVPDTAGPYVTDLDALKVGQAAVATGAGRQTKEDEVDPTAGFSALRKPGDSVEPGDVLARIHTKRTEDIDVLRERLLAAYSFGDEPPEPTSAVWDRYTADGWTGASD
jgi:pyrimidine-nucleoside phosphorylase